MTPLAAFVEKALELLRSADERELIAGRRYYARAVQLPDVTGASGAGSAGGSPAARLEISFCAEAADTLDGAMDAPEYVDALRALEDQCVALARRAIDGGLATEALVRVEQAGTGDVFDYMLIPV